MLKERKMEKETKQMTQNSNTTQHYRVILLPKNIVHTHTHLLCLVRKELDDVILYPWVAEEDKEAPADGPALLLESEQVWSVGGEGGRERQGKERVIISL